MPRHPEPGRVPARATGPTILRRLVGIGAIGWAVSSPAAEPMDEVELLRHGLAAPVARTELEAASLRARAERTGTSLLRSPTVDVRHEEARGEWGATSNAVGLSTSLDLGLSPLKHTRAGRLRGAAEDARRAALALERACGLRADAVELWAANRSATVGQAAQARLVALLDTSTERMEAADLSPYARDRTALAVMTHQTPTAERQGSAARLRAQLSSRLGDVDVQDVALAPLPPLPELESVLDALGDHPGLRALTLERDGARAALEAARLDQIPDLSLAGGPRWDTAPIGFGPADPPVSVGYEIAASVQIPWTDGTRAAARRQSAELAELETRLVRATAEREAAVLGAHRRAEAIALARPPEVDPESVWRAALQRYERGESSLDDLLDVATAVEDAHLARIERERLARSALLELACATGRFADPALQSVVDETLK